MLKRAELHNVRNTFSVEHVYSLKEYQPDLKLSHKEVELSHYDGCCYIIIHAVHEHVQEQPTVKAKWLLDVIFSFGKTSDFQTSKDAHVHVMVSLDTLINVAAE